MKRSSTLIILFMIFFSTLVFSEETIEEEEISVDSSEEIVITATKNEENRYQTTLPVETVKKEEIEEKMPVTASELAGNLPGVSLQGPAGNYFLNPAIRGLGGRRVVMVIDGARIDTEKTVGVTGYFVDAQDLSRLEVVRGPGSVLYGSDALGGIVSFFSTDPFEHKGLNAGNKFFYASNNSEISNFTSAGWSNEKFALRVTAKYRDADEMVTGSGETLENTSYTDKNYSLKLGYRPIKNHTLRLSGYLFDGGTIGKAATAGDDEKRRRINFPKDRHYLGTLSYDIDNGEFFKKTSFSFYYDYTDRHQHVETYLIPWITDHSNKTLDNVNDKYGDFISTGWNINTTIQPFTFTKITFGTDGNFKNLNSREVAQSMRTLPTGELLPPDVIYPFDDSYQLDLALFSQVEQLINEKIALKGGARYDFIKTSYLYDYGTYENNEVMSSYAGKTESITNHAFSGNAGAVYSPFDFLNLTFNVGRAFRAPTLREKYAVVESCKGRYIGNQDLKPEASLNFDLGIKGRKSFFSYEAYGFATLIDNYIAGMPTGNSNEYKYENIVEAGLYGGEVKVVFDFRKLFWKIGLKLTESIAYVYGEDRKENVALPNIPPFVNNTGVRIYSEPFSFVKSVFGEFTLIHNAEQNRINPALNTGSEEEKETPSYTVFNTSIGLRTKDYAGFSAGLMFGIDNLTDKTYRNHLSPNDEMGRNVKIGINLNYN